MERDENGALSPSIKAAVELAATQQATSSSNSKQLHRAELRKVAFFEGVEGVRAYKAANPEAASIRVELTAIAYNPKPKEYNRYLAELARKWLTSDEAAASTNIADVERLNTDLGTNCDPTKHFNEKLTPTRLAGIRKEFAKLGVPLNDKSIDTMSKVKMAAMAARGRSSSTRFYGRLGSVSGNTLVVRDHVFSVERHGGRDSIRVMIGRRRRRLYVEDMEWVANLISPAIEADPLALHDTNTCIIGELAHSVGKPAIAPNDGAEISELAPACSLPGLSQRLSALKAMQAPAPKGVEDEVDPLSNPLNL